MAFVLVRAIRKNRTNKAFTLLEVLAALMLFAVAVGGIIQGQSNSVRSIVRAERMSQALSLAELKMTELELEIQKKNFEAFDADDSGDFKEDQLEAYRWQILLEEVDLSCFIPTPEEQSQTEGGFMNIIQDFFEKSIRKAIVRVQWDEGAQTRSVEVVQLLIRFEDIPNSLR